MTETTTWATVEGAADHIKGSTWTIRKAVKDGDLPAYSIGKGREYRLKLQDVDEWLSAKAFEPRS
jgi:excisionase family DNA binding protein